MRARFAIACATLACATLACATLACAPAVPSTPPGGLATERAWVGTWMAAPQLVEVRNLPPSPGLPGNTLRQVMRTTIGGSAARVRLSNAFSDAPATVRRARIARRGATAGSIDPATDRALTFGGREEVTIPAGGEVVSDVLTLQVPALTEFVVSLHFGGMPSNVTGHPGSRTTSFLVPSDRARDEVLTGATPVERWYVLSGIDVLAAPGTAAVVVLGNSIADGRGSGTDRNNRWPDELARRLRSYERTAHIAVLNAGIGGNAVLEGGLGPTARARLERDVLDKHGARWLIVSIGVNDIGGASDASAPGVARELIAAYRAIAARARARGIRVIGATILPFAGSQYDSPAREAARQAVNHWIRTGGAWDAVVDFDAIMRDPGDTLRLRGDLDTGDHLHPNEAGYVAMAAAVDLRIFTESGLRLARIFQDGAVLQRDAALPVRGHAMPGDSVHVTLAGRTLRTVAAPDGAWRVVFPAFRAGGPHAITVTAARERIERRDLLFGDVWVAAGQSNMEWPVASSNDAAREIASAHDLRIRAFRVPHSWSDTPQGEVTDGRWSPADSAHVGGMTAA